MSNSSFINPRRQLLLQGIQYLLGYFKCSPGNIQVISSIKLSRFNLGIKDIVIK